MFYEIAEKDRLENKSLDHSGGNILFYHTGIDFYYGRFSINTALQIPLSQDLNGIQPQLKSRFIAGVMYSIN
jgi:hypothetical protein